MMKMNRRNILKLGAGSMLAAILSPFVSAQSSNLISGSAGATATPKLDGTVSYNAGWVVPLEDKASLLELEAKKTKERDDLNKQKTAANSDNSASSKEKPKTFSDKFNNFLGKMKSYF